VNQITISIKGVAMAFKAEQVGEYFVRRRISTENPIDLVQVIKITYIAHGYHLAIFDKPLISEPVEAWQYGPVIPEIYRLYKAWYINKITKPNSSIDISPLKNDASVRDLLNIVFDKYSQFTASELIRLTHKKGHPWEQVFNRHERSIIIPQKLITTHYQGLLDGVPN
jgi:uncharacterized phage-associated protein